LQAWNRAKAPTFICCDAFAPSDGRRPLSRFYNASRRANAPHCPLPISFSRSTAAEIFHLHVIYLIYRYDIYII
jgi:hypothetical protein